MAWNRILQCRRLPCRFYDKFIYHTLSESMASMPISTLVRAHHGVKPACSSHKTLFYGYHHKLRTPPKCRIHSACFPTYNSCRLSCTMTGNTPRSYSSHFMAPYSSSALYVPHGDDSNVAAVEVDLDLESTFKDVDLLQQNLKTRSIQNVDVQTLLCEYQELCHLQHTQHQLEEEREDIINQMKVIVKKKQAFDDEKKKALIARGKEVREELKTIYTKLWPLEESVIMAALKLPAPLQADTPEEDVILQEIGDKPLFNFDVCSHVELGQKNNFLHFSSLSPGAYYLEGYLAHLELHLLARISTALHARGLVQYSCPDFAKTLVTEGCAEDYGNPKKVFTLQSKETPNGSDDPDISGKVDTTLHLVGGASYASWAAYLAKMNFATGNLPLRVFSVGRHYTPANYGKDTPVSLLNVPQSNQVSVFAATESAPEASTIFQEYQTLICEIYKDLGIAARVVRVCGSRLRLCEISRVELHLWMPSSQKYVPVAEVGLCNDYISRRLMMKHSADIKDVHNRNYLHMVHGCVLNTAPVLAAIMENYQTKDGEVAFSIPDNLRYSELK